MMDEYRMWLNRDRTVLVTLWIKSGQMTVSLRDRQEDIWGPPIEVTEK